MRTILIALLLSLPAASPAEGEDNLIDVRFPGGSASRYLAAIREAAGDVNVLVAPEAAEVEMPPVSLRKVSVAAAINLLDGKERGDTNRIVRLKVHVMPTYSPAERTTYQIRADVRQNRERVPGAYVWSVSTLLDHDISSAALLSAVEMALDVIGSDTPLDVRFHEDTGLLIAMGDIGQMETIDGVLEQLQDSVDARISAKEDENAAGLHHEMMRLEMLAAELTRMLESRNHELAVAREELHALERELERERARREIFNDDARP